MKNAVIAIIISLAIIALAITLKLGGVIGEPSLVVLLGTAIFVGLIICLADRVKSFDLKSLKVELEKVERSKNEVERLSYLTLKFILLSQKDIMATGGRSETEKRMREISNEIVSHLGTPKNDEIHEIIENELGAQHA